jgi:hypothetical protein
MVEEKHLDFEETAKRNQDAYGLLFEIENILRFFIVDTLNKKDPFWWKNFNKPKIIENTEIIINEECTRRLSENKKVILNRSAH